MTQGKSRLRGALGEAGMSLPVQVWSVQSLASRTGASLTGVTATWGPERSGRMGCGIDSRNRLIAAAELAPAPAKAAHPLSLSERADAPPGAKARSRPNGSCRNLTGCGKSPHFGK